MKFKDYINESIYKLKEGDVILVQGFVMLQNLENNKYYKILSVDPVKKTYLLAKSNKTGSKVASVTSKKNRVRHNISSVDALIDTKGENTIKKV